MINHTKVLIIGSGPAGYTAAIYSARAGLSPVLFTGAQIGGQLTQTSEVENFPGFSESIFGFDLMEKMKHQAERFGTKILSESVHEVEITSRPFLCTGEKTAYLADSIIIATGATAKWLGVPGEEDFKGHTVSGCATCDGFFYRGKDVAVIGGGNVAVTDALFLTNHAKRVILIHRRDSLRAEKTLQDRIFSNNKVEFIWNSVVTEICGNIENKKIEHVNISNITTGIKSSLKIDGLFVAIGHTPQTKLFTQKLQLNEAGYIATKPSTTETSIPGIFAAGDVTDEKYRQAVTAAGSGCMAAMDAERFLT
jgi:thioredoxin reductase (NADPH)